MKNINKLTKVAASGLALLAVAVLPPAVAQNDKEYLLTVTRPHHLHVVDTETNALLRSCELPARMGPGHVFPSPDGRIAYVLMDGWENIYGVEIATCAVVFSALQSFENVKVSTHGSVTISADGKELYTVQNLVRHLSDRFEVMEPRFAVYNTADGLKAQPVRTFPVDRRITTIAATEAGKVILGGADVKEIDPQTGDTRTVALLQNEERPRWLTPDAFAMFNLGEQANEYILPYVTAEFTDDSNDLATAAWWWGMVRVDLTTGEAQRSEVIPFEFIVFNFVADPNDKNTLYGVFNTLSKHDVAAKKTLKTVRLDHSHYNINISGDGKRVYLGGTSNDIAVYDTETLEKVASIELPAAMAASDLRIVKAVD